MSPYGSKSYKTLRLLHFVCKPNFTVNMVVTEECSLKYCGDRPKRNFLWHFKFCFHHRTIEYWKFQNAAPPTVFIRAHPKCISPSATMVEYRLFPGTMKFSHGSEWEIVKCGDLANG